MPDRPPVILHVDDDKDYVSSVAIPLCEAGYRLCGAYSLQAARQVLESTFVDLVLLDERIGRELGTLFLKELRVTHPGLGAIIVSGHADYELAVSVMDLGAVGILAKGPMSDEDLVSKVRLALENSQVARQARVERWFADREADFPEIVGTSAAINQIKTIIRKVAPTDATVLILGEAGTGKELVARAIHYASPRRTKPYHVEDLGALAGTLIESTLFGHRKGAFTDATENKKGAFEAANGGTLFLDEVGNTTLEVQAKLLRVLEERTVKAVGDTRAIPLDIRLVAATNKNLEKAVESGSFREDLYHRLNVVQVQLPPLRERPEDIEAITLHILKEQNRRKGKEFLGVEEEGFAILRAHSWPGNVRELRNVIENAVVFAEGAKLRAGDLRLQGRNRKPEFGNILDQPWKAAKDEFARYYFERLMRRANGNKSLAARLAEVNRSSIDDHLEGGGEV